MIRMCAVAAALLFLLAAAGPGQATRPLGNPGNATVRVSLPPGFVADTKVVRRAGSAWFAMLVSSAAAPATLRIYRWTERHWQLDGVVRIDELPIFFGGPGGVAAASVTGHDAPDFTIGASGADTRWFGVVSRIRGRWQMVPFDYGRGRTAAIDAAGVRHGLVRAETNGCGCAAGPETYSWYRFNGRIFVPTNPPGLAPACSSSALGGAPALREVWTVDPQLRKDLHRPLTIGRYACRDGWALARGLVNGHERLALYEQEGRHWLKLAAGPGSAMSRGVGIFSIARSLFRRLKSELGLPLGKLGRTRSPYAPYVRFSTKYASAEDLAPVTTYIPPGADYVNTVAHRKNGRWLATAVESHLNAAHGRATVTVQIYRWSSRRWVSQARVPIVVRVPHGDGRLFAISAAFLTRSAVPDFELGGMATIPSWAAVVSHVGGTWHVVPFRAGGQTSTTAEVPQSEFPDRGRVVVQRAHGTVDYRLRDGIFQPTHSVTPDPPCRKSSLPPRRRSAVTRLACAYGYALGTGVNRRGKSVAVVFAVLNGRWRFDLSARTPARALRQDGTVPLWLASLLERELRP